MSWESEHWFCVLILLRQNQSQRPASKNAWGTQRPNDRFLCETFPPCWHHHGSGVVKDLLDRLAPEVWRWFRCPMKSLLKAFRCSFLNSRHWQGMTCSFNTTKSESTIYIYYTHTNISIFRHHLYPRFAYITLLPFLKGPTARPFFH